MAPEDILKTAVITLFGLYEYLVMVERLRNAGQTFQRYMTQALGDHDFVFFFFDDVFVASTSLAEHEEHLRIVLERLDKFHLFLNLGKCVLEKPQLRFLGDIVGTAGLRPYPEKV